MSFMAGINEPRMTPLYVLLVIVEVTASASLLDIDDRLMEWLNGYIRSQEDEINQLKRLADEFRREIDVSRSASDPVTAFKVTRRLVKDWKAARFLVTDSGAKDEFRRKWRGAERVPAFPNEEDLAEATSNMHRFDISSIASGKHGVKNTNELTARECYDIGRFSYGKLDFDRAAQWLSQALVRYDTEDEWLHFGRTSVVDPQKTLKWRIYDTLPLSIFQGGNKERALNLTKAIKDEFKNHEGAWNAHELIEKVLQKTEAAKSPVSEISPNEKTLGERMIIRYESLCRRSIESATDVTKLKCRYVTTSPFTKLARLKEEEVILRPRIVVFREVIHDSEIESIKQIITPLMRRGLAADDSGTAVHTSRRIAKQYFIPDSRDVVGKIRRRVEDMSGMSTESAEDVNVVNYGLGGHYVIHYDHERDENRMPPDWEGNRIASLLFYLSDVEKGGDTAFPALNVSVRPEKGSVLMWRNLLYNGDGDNRIMHAACPVLQGSKWVITYLLHTVGNELRQQCRLNRHE